MRALLLLVLIVASSAQAQSTVAGSMPGSFRVTESGAAEYRIPIQVPPGVAGMEPKLALVYNSQGGNGLLGVGWGLEGLSAITRCPRTIAQDGVKGEINYDANDRYCLDGQRLMVVSGSYGGDGAEYRTERESFSKVIGYGNTCGSGPCWFKLWTKSGQILEYGNTDDSRIEAQGKSSVRVWAVNKVADTKTGYLTVTYTEDNPNGDFRVSRIDYTGNAAAAQAPVNSVQFTYESRADVVPAFEAGSVMKTMARLTNARTYAAASMVADYRIAYGQSPGTGRSLASSITLCGPDACLPAASFGWTDGDLATLTAKPQVLPFSGGYVTPYWQYSWHDVNGDGRADLVMTYQDGTGSGRIAVQVALSNGDGSFSVMSQVEIFSGGYVTPYWQYSWNDVNGDRRADLVMTYQDGTGSGRIAVQVALSNGDGSFSVKPQVEIFGGGYITPYWRYSWNDVNGDGRADLMLTYQDGSGSGRIALHPVLSNGDGSFSVKPQVEIFSGGYITPYWRYSWNDVSGDGKADLVLTYQNPAGAIAVHLVSTSPIPLAAQTFAAGSGITTALTYAPLTSGGSVYTRDSDATYPVIDLQVPIYVATAATTSNGIGGAATTNYAYGGLKAELGTGRGLLGFRWMESTQQATGVKARTELRQDWPYVGLPSLVKKTQSSGAVLSQTANAFSCTNPASGAACTVAAGNRYFPYVSQSVETGNDLNGAALPTVTTTNQYDIYGNATSVVVSTGGGYSKTTSNIFTNDVPNWILGRLTRSTVQSTAP